MEFEKFIQQEFETEKTFLNQYKRGLSSLVHYSAYRLSAKDGKRYYIVDRKSRQEKRIANDQFYIVKNLRRQKLCETGIKVLERNLKALERLMAVYRPYDPASLEEKLSPAYRTSAEELELMRNQAAGSGKRYTQSENPFHPEHLKHITSFGLIVRSRIEAAAAELAYHAGYYIMYEKRIVLCDEEGNMHVVYPDFILCDNENSPDATWIYWEHLGLLDFGEYRELTMRKLKLFPQNGILPGRNLILTTDGMDQSIDLMAVRNVLDSITNLEVMK